MRVFAVVVAASSFTAAARMLGLPKQTLSRRVANLERALGVQLMHRTTRRLQPSDVGAAYADRCAEIIRIADAANRAVGDAQQAPRGTLRITADPVFGETFLVELVTEYARRWPEVRLDVVLSRRRVDLAAEGFDIAIRIGHVDDAQLSGFRLGPAAVRYCASAGYIARRGAPTKPAELRDHDCIVVSDGGPVRWPFRGARGATMVPVAGRLTSTSFSIAHAAVVAGLGIGVFPEFACAQDVRRGRLVSVLDEWVVEVGSVWLVHASRRFVSARVRAFADLARERFGRTPPWIVTDRDDPPARRPKRPIRRA